MLDLILAFGLWPLIFRVECPSNSVVSLVWPRTEIWRKGCDLTIPRHILCGCPGADVDGLAVLY